VHEYIVWCDGIKVAGALVFFPLWSVLVLFPFDAPRVVILPPLSYLRRALVGAPPCLRGGVLLLDIRRNDIKTRFLKISI
jgi:hypothetical protein